jgi:ATP-dependent Lon protease
MPRRYNLRKRPETTVKWIEDDTLIKDDEDEDDSDYEPQEEEEDEDEMDCDEEDDDEESIPIQIPMPKKGVRVKIEIDNRRQYDEDEEDLELDEEDEEEEEFIDYLMNKYVPTNKIKLGKPKKDKKEVDEPALELNDEEQTYYDKLTKTKRKVLNKKMKELSEIMKDGDVPHKFRVLEMPISNSVKAMVIKKLEILENMEMEGGETHKLRTWVDGFLRIPFGVHVPLPVKIDDGAKPCADFLSQTRKKLDSAVYGMNSAKTQIMQTIAQWISNPNSVGNVIALHGPAGVGKTSIAKNGISAVLSRPFEFFSLGGASDSANFVGHSYTYEGSMWGRIADALMNARCMNPVLYFDELDKISETAHGQEIVNMLIHMTDRSQNTQFHDKYFAGVDFDLSQCLFVFSLNDESKIHPILKDRMQFIHCSGYTSDEKKIILTQYVWPQVMDRIKIDGLTISEEAIKHLIQEYSKEEEGVRTLIRAVETLVTRINLLRIADEETAKSYKFYTKISLPLCIGVDIAKHILQDLHTPMNESWRHLYT